MAAFVLEIDVFVFRDELAELEVGVARIEDDVRFIIDHALEIGDRHAEQATDYGRQALEEPDMHDGHGQFDMAHALAAHLGMGDFHAATIANDAAVADALVLAAGAFPVLHGPKMRSQNSPSFSGLKER